MTTAPTPTHATEALAARTAVHAVFFLNGFTFATWASRIPSVRSELGLTPAGLGLLLLGASVGAVIALPTAGGMVQRFGARRMVTIGAGLMATGLVTAGVGTGALGSVPATVAGLFLLGFGNGSWDVAMNIEGAAVERRLRRSVMPRFHASFSLGTVAGGLVGTVAAWLAVDVGWHLAVAALLVGIACAAASRGFLAVEDGPSDHGPREHPLRAWTEPRTLVLGVMVLAMALTEGVANDWLAVAVVDGYDAPGWLGSAAFALFVAAMTAGRVAGTSLLDAFGRVRVLWSSMAVAACGVLLVVLGQVAPLVALGVVLWGVGASLGFPVGMSAAADDPARAAARVSVVSTIGYLAFLGGPPLLGFLGSRFGVLDALLLISVILVPSAMAVPATRKPARVR